LVLLHAATAGTGLRKAERPIQKTQRAPHASVFTPSRTLGQEGCAAVWR
jgi:hypothetical protein